MTRFAIALLAVPPLALFACGGASSSPTATSSIAGTPSSTAQPTTATGEAPEPQHLTFAPGQTIRADGKAGVFFLDPKIGAADAWVVPASVADRAPGLPYTFTIGGVSGDGSRVVYECLEPRTDAVPGPCGGGTDHLWYLLDTQRGSRTRLAAFTGPSVTISPDARTLLGITPDGVALADAADPSATRPVPMPQASGLPIFASWSPDSANVIVGTGVSGYPVTGTFLLRVADTRLSTLDVTNPAMDWSSDGSKIALATQDSRQGSLVVVDRDGTRIWSRQMDMLSPNPRWSSDGSLLSLQVLASPPSDAAPSGIVRLDIFDGVTGATSYRVAGAIACQDPVWTGDAHRLLVGSYAATAGSSPTSLIDLAALSVTPLNVFLTPLPFDADHAVVADGSSFSLVDLSTGAKTLIARTTVTPGWDALHANQPRFAGGRIVFTSLHLGHGGCGEGGSPATPPRLELLQGPFADDGPVTRGP